MHIKTHISLCRHNFVSTNVHMKFSEVERSKVLFKRSYWFLFLAFWVHSRCFFELNMVIVSLTFILRCLTEFMISTLTTVTDPILHNPCKSLSHIYTKRNRKRTVITSLLKSIHTFWLGNNYTMMKMSGFEMVAR